MTGRRWIAAVTVAVLLAGCAAGPAYRVPSVEAAAGFKELGDWKPSEPADGVPGGPWWRVYNDEVLDRLEAQVEVSNETVRAAAAALDQALAVMSQYRAGYWPTVSVSADRRRGSSAGGPATNAASVGGSALWNLDLWGGIRRNVESGRSSADASQAALAAVRLTAQAQLATSYFELRAQDQLQRLLDDTVAAQQQSFKITESRYRFGVAAKADVVNAQAQLLSSQALQVNARIQRGILEHAIAVLIGQQPASFALAVAPLRTDVPVVPAGVPSSLLERRPDVAEAERKVAAANAQIGVAIAAYFPSLTLSGSNQYSGSGFDRLIRVPNRVWSVGPALAGTLFAGGLHRSQVAQARAAYEGSVATYRQTVLTGFQQVENQLVTLRVLEEQAIIEEAAVKAARQAEVLTLNQYKAGAVPYSSVITTQTTTLSREQAALSVLSNRLQASVALIEALGGGWTVAGLH